MSNIAKFQFCFERYETDPGRFSKLLRTESAEDPKNYLNYAIPEILVERPVSRNLQFLAELAIPAGLLEYVVELYGRSRTQGIALAVRASACSARFDRALLAYVQQSASSKLDEETLLHIGLDILNAISKDERFVPDVLKLLKHPNPKVRSKAALFLGSRTNNLSWVAKRSDDDNARVRANILEGLCGLESDAARQIFWDNVTDANNRVVGNALLGLYLLGESDSIPLIYEMAGNADARFRNTCAWLMGKVRDARFSTMLSGFMSDPDELVRSQALKSLGETRKALKEAQNKPQWETAIVRSDHATETSLIALVHDSAGSFVHGIPATSFILRTGILPCFVRDYSVSEFDRQTPLDVAFVVCLPSEPKEDTEANFSRVIQACSGLRRPKDRWGIIKVNRDRVSADRDVEHASEKRRSPRRIFDTEPRRDFSLEKPAAPQGTATLVYSSEQPRIDSMMQSPPLWASEVSNLQLSAWLPTTLYGSHRGKQHLHLIVLGASSNADIPPDLLRSGSSLPATVHVLAWPDATQMAESQTLASSTGGVYKTVSSFENMQQVCSDLYSSLLQNYRISWKEGAGNIKLEVNSASGRGCAEYDFESASDAPQSTPSEELPLLA